MTRPALKEFLPVFQTRRHEITKRLNNFLFLLQANKGRAEETYRKMYEVRPLLGQILPLGCSVVIQSSNLATF
jgi:hypothetical protein